jgi:GTP-sensing pleiotropic transcriptional regulator CodY
LTILIHQLRGDQSGIYFIDSTKLQICHNKRTSSNRAFCRIAEIARVVTSGLWVINNKGEIMNFKITKANKNDLVADHLSKGLIAW